MQAKQFKYEENESKMNYEKRNENKRGTEMKDRVSKKQWNEKNKAKNYIFAWCEKFYAKKLKRIFQLNKRNVSEMDLFSLHFTSKRNFVSETDSPYAGVSIMQVLPLMKTIFACIYLEIDTLYEIFLFIYLFISFVF